MDLHFVPIKKSSLTKARPREGGLFLRHGFLDYDEGGHTSTVRRRVVTVAGRERAAREERVLRRPARQAPHAVERELIGAGGLGHLGQPRVVVVGVISPSSNPDTTSAPVGSTDRTCRRPFSKSARRGAPPIFFSVSASARAPYSPARDVRHSPESEWRRRWRLFSRPLLEKRSCEKTQNQDSN